MLIPLIVCLLAFFHIYVFTNPKNVTRKTLFTLLRCVRCPCSILSSARCAYANVVSGNVEERAADLKESICVQNSSFPREMGQWNQTGKTFPTFALVQMIHSV